MGVLLASIVVPSLAGNLEDAVRQRTLGFKYYHGDGVAQDNAKAVALFEKAAHGGDVQSASNLGMMYEYGMGVVQDETRAAAWYLKAAESGDPASQYRVSEMYYKGRGVARDRTEAAKWWTLAMMAGGGFAQSIRTGVESAEAKLTPGELAEGRRRAADWATAHGTGK